MQLTDMKNRFRQRKRDALESGLTSAQRAALHSVSTFERMSASAQIKAVAEARRVALLADRPGPLSWRAWLEKEARAGDKAALSALRGIVYQEGRDAKKGTVEDSEDIDAVTDDAEKVLSSLLEHERQEHAIRPATPGRMRAYQADALLRDIQGMKWKVTSNGNVEYQRASGSVVFVDRGHRLTFDRQLVTDEDLALTLIHAREKWASGVVLTGGDPAFTQRMIKAAVEAGVTVKNPELQHMQANKDRQLSCPVD
jgi:hypothetical protein